MELCECSLTAGNYLLSQTDTNCRDMPETRDGYFTLLTLEFVFPPVNDDEDLILKEENPEIYAHLENVLVHMIDAQDVAIFKSQKDYIRNRQQLSEYLCCQSYSCM